MTKVEIIQKALEDKKATNIEVLDVAEQTSLLYLSLSYLQVPFE